MRSPETGGPEDDTETEDGAEVEDVILEVQQECAAAINTTPNREALNVIFDMARTTYEKDTKAWDQLFEALESELNALDEGEDDEVSVILDNYKRKATVLG